MGICKILLSDTLSCQGYSCSESIVMEAIEKGLVPKELLPVATSFSGGMGSGCLCERSFIYSIIPFSDKVGNSMSIYD